MTLAALKTDEEIALVPLDREILIELPGMAGEIATEAKTGKDTDRGSKTDDGAKTLQEQLEAMKAAQQASDDRAARAEADAASARQEAADRRREADDARSHASTLEKDIITGGLSAAQADLLAAEAELERAGEAGDFKAMAKAQTRIGRASAQIVNLEGGAAEIAERVERKPEQRREAAPDPMSIVDANQNLLPAEKTWLKSHPDSIIDARRNTRLGVGYDLAVEKGLVRGTADYFAFLDDFMGYAKSADTNHDGTERVQAPVTRLERGNDGRPQGSRITLSPEQREIAKSLGVSEIDYAKQVLAFEADKKANPEKYGQR